MTERAQVGTADLLVGGGEMGDRIRSFDWSKTAFLYISLETAS